MNRTIHPNFLLALFVFYFSSASAQSFKGYTDLPGFHAPMKFSVNEVVGVPGSSEFVMVGDFKASAPTYSAGAFLIRADHTGQAKLSRLLYTNFPNGTNGVVGRSVAIDSEGNYLVGGASVQNVFLGGGSERTITLLNAKGQEIWSRMQSNYSFESVIYQPEDESIITLSGPVGNANPFTNIMVNRLNTKGLSTGAFSLNTPTTDRPVKIIAVPDGGFLALGVYDETSPQPLLLRLDKNLNRVWSYSFYDNAMVSEPKDVVWHSEGFFAVTGQATAATGESLMYVMGIDDTGQLLFYNKYESYGKETLLANAITTYTSPVSGNDNGFLVAGTFLLPGSGRKRGFVLKTDSSGKVVWARNYSNLTEITDYDRDETLEDIVFFRHSDDFVAVGNFTQSLQGVVNQRKLITVRADAGYGILSEAYNTCAAGLEIFLSKSENMNRISVGAPQYGGTMFGFSYDINNLETFTDYCAWPTEGVIPPKGSSSGESYVDPFTGTVTLTYDLIVYRKDGLLEMFDMQGRMIHQTSLNWQQTEVTLQMRENAKGAYLVRIRTGDHILNVRKVLIW
ncbi:MAG: T9SS type A sorting domain-containing protein [Bacteroidia bacterium]|nr:T9SS type A sorting domain-containing protein [Bacteroidia bacterium]